MSRLLINEHPLQVLPSLATAIGLNEAIVLQQLHYWAVTKEPDEDGTRWVYNSVAQWMEQFPFWCEKTFRRIVDKLKRQGLVRTRKDKARFGIQTLSYAIDYDRLEAIASGRGPDEGGPSGPADHIDRNGAGSPGQNDQMQQGHPVTLTTACGQRDQIPHPVNLTDSLTETTTEITTEITHTPRPREGARRRVCVEEGKPAIEKPDWTAEQRVAFEEFVRPVSEQLRPGPNQSPPMLQAMVEELAAFQVATLRKAAKAMRLDRSVFPTIAQAAEACRKAEAGIAGDLPARSLDDLPAMIRRNLSPEQRQAYLDGRLTGMTAGRGAAGCGAG